MKHAAVLVLCFCSIAFAQQPAADSSVGSAAQKGGDSAAVTPAKEAKIRELVRITGTAEVAIDFMKRQIGVAKKTIPIPPKAQDDFADQFIAAVDKGEFLRLLIPIYARHFSEADLDGMIAFYQTPLGQKTIKELPLVVAEAQQAGADWGRELGTRIGTRIAQRVQAGEYGPWPPSGSAASPGNEQGFKPSTPAPPQN